MCCNIFSESEGKGRIYTTENSTNNIIMTMADAATILHCQYTQHLLEFCKNFPIHNKYILVLNLVRNISLVA